MGTNEISITLSQVFSLQKYCICWYRKLYLFISTNYKRWTEQSVRIWLVATLMVMERLLLTQLLFRQHPMSYFADRANTLSLPVRRHGYVINYLFITKETYFPIMRSRGTKLPTVPKYELANSNGDASKLSSSRLSDNSWITEVQRLYKVMQN